MSQENVEIARKAIEAWNAGDMDRLRDLYDPAAVYTTPPDWIDSGPYLGRDAIIKQFRELRDVWQDDSSFGRPELLDAGDHVVVQIPFRSATRGLALSTELAWVYTLRDGLIVTLAFFHSKAEALEAVGLGERPMSHEVELVRRWTWAFENDTDAFRDTLHPELEWFPFEENHACTHGVEGGMRIRNGWLDSWDEHSVDLEAIAEEGDSVITTAHVTARGRTSGVEVDIRLYVQFKVRDAKIAYVFEHEDRDAALEAARLPE